MSAGNYIDISQTKRSTNLQMKQPAAWCKEAKWLSGRVLDSRPKGRGFEPHRRHCVVSLSKNIYPSLVLVPPRKTRPYITERLLIGLKESNQTNNQTKCCKQASNMLTVTETLLLSHSLIKKIVNIMVPLKCKIIIFDVIIHILLTSNILKS